jgi:PKD repeat protein
MKVLKKSVILTICLMLVFSLFGQKEKTKKLTLDQMRMEIARQGYNFTVGTSAVSDLPLEYLCGLVEPPDWRETGNFDNGYGGLLGAPASWDWRTQGVVTPIQNQGSCGSCWAFGTIGSYESCVAVAGGGLDNLSEEWLLDCNTQGYDCGGGWWGYPDMYNGVPLESCYPYVGSAGTCNTSCPKYHPMDEWYYVGSSSGVPSTTAIKDAMYEHGPISAAVYVDSYFQAYSSGIFTNTGSSSPNHAIVLVGWNDTGGYWILKNSWGTSWGESGYMRIAYGANNVGYSASYGVPQNVTPQPPVADFSASPNPVAVGNSVQFTDLSTNSPTSWAWTFTGGTPSSSSSQNPQVTYNTIGTYTVSLTVTNAVGNDTETKTNYITVQEQVIEYCASSGNSQSYEYIAGVGVSNLSNSSGASGYSDFTYMTATVVEGESAAVSLTPGFTGSSYAEYWRIWVDYNVDGDFDDSGEQVFSGSGSSTVNGSFTPPSGTAGVITRMRVSMQYGSYPSSCGTFTYGEVEDYTLEVSEGVVDPPVANFSASDTTIYVGDSVNFTDLTTNNPTSWSWTFSGGTPSGSSQQNPTVTYNSAGTFTVSLTAANSAGNDTETKNNYITVSEIPIDPPVAAFTANTTTVTVGGSVSFTDQSTNNPTSWSWSFESGTPSSSISQNPTVQYNTAGTFDVSLTATNSSGSDNETKTNYITVNPASGDEIAEAVDYTGLTFTKSGNADWTKVTDIYYYGGDSAKSGTITHNQSTTIETNVTVGSTQAVKFYWKVSSEANYDYLRFYIDGVEKTKIAGTVNWTQVAYNITAGTHTLKWSYTKDGSVSTGSDCGWVDKLEITAPAADPIAEAVDYPGLTFTLTGNANWFSQTTTTYYGGDAAQSGDIGNNQTSTMETTISGKTSVKFYWRVSSETNYDYLRFYIDGVQQHSISGSTSWAQRTYTVSSGTHTLKWSFTKDGSVSSGSDCGWVDKLELQ